MRICVFGLWHLGCVTAACVAEAGHDVVAIDTDPLVIENLRNGVPPLFEPGLADLMQREVGAGRLRYSICLQDVAECEVLWVCHDTPVDDDDRADVAYVIKEVQTSFPYLRDGTVVLISAQLPVGTIAAIEEAFAEHADGREVTFACSPENLRLGKALEIFREPGRIIVGVRDGHARRVLEPLLGGICERLIWMSVESAEMVKHALNAFLAVCVTFTNEVAAICEKVGADASDVEKGLRSDPRVGQSAYVRPGPAFAGGTLARDIQFLSGIADHTQARAPLIDAVLPSNQAHRRWPFNQLISRLSPLARRRIAVLGLSYKPGTDSMRRSSAIELVHDLAAAGAEIRAYDPAVRELPHQLAARVELAPDVESAIKDAAAIVIATEWPEFRKLGEADFAAAAAGCIVLDPGRCLSPRVDVAGKFKVITIGTGA